MNTGIKITTTRTLKSLYEDIPASIKIKINSTDFILSNCKLVNLNELTLFEYLKN
jgi:hypothetical protein